MPKPRVYVETTIPNLYHETRTAPESVEARLWTCAWWADAADRYELLTSVVVIDELDRGTSSRTGLRKSLLAGIPVLQVVTPIPEIVAFYIKHKLMPANPPDDAYHLAISSYHRCDFMLTWNCRHLANPNKALHIRRINTMLGLGVPSLATPKDLMLRRGDE
jgi:hypothetical protein